MSDEPDSAETKRSFAKRFLSSNTSKAILAGGLAASVLNPVRAPAQEPVHLEETQYTQQVSSFQRQPVYDLYRDITDAINNNGRFRPIASDLQISEWDTNQINKLYTEITTANREYIRAVQKKGAHQKTIDEKKEALDASVGKIDGIHVSSRDRTIDGKVQAQFTGRLLYEAAKGGSDNTILITTIATKSRVGKDLKFKTGPDGAPPVTLETLLRDGIQYKLSQWSDADVNDVVHLIRDENRLNSPGDIKNLAMNSGGGSLSR